MKKLKRSLGLLDVYVICTGAMFSSGFFLLPGLAASQAGPAVMLSYFLAGLLIIPSVLSTAELCTAMPRAGGGYLFIDRSMGPLVGTVGGISTWVALNFKTAFTLIGMGAYLSLLVEIPIHYVAVGLTFAFAALNIFGVHAAMGVQRVLVICLLLVLGLFIVEGLISVVHSDVDVHQQRMQPFMPFGVEGVLSTAAFVFISYLGLTKVATMAEEIKRPSRNIPLGIFLALATTTLLYVVGVYVMVAVLESDMLYDNNTPVAATAETTMDWLPGQVGYYLVIAAALAAFISTANAGLLSSARYPVAMARDHVFPQGLKKVGRFHTPARAVVLSALIIVLMIIFVPLEEVVKMGSATQLVLFILLNSAVIVMRSSKLRTYQPGFRSPLYPWTQYAGILISAVLLYELGWGPLLFSVGLAALGVAWYYLYARKHVSRDAAIFHILGRNTDGNIEEELQTMCETRKEADKET